MEVNPIATFRTRKKHPYEAARQGSVEVSDEIGELHFSSGLQFEQALEDIDGFSHLWLIYLFHLNQAWKPKVLPPRGSSHKVGVFSTRSPYRPNPIGLSCVELVEHSGLILRVRGFDLLDETPILDVKPYIRYADSFPDSRMGWLEGIESAAYSVSFSVEALSALEFLRLHGVSELQNFLIQQLSFDPLEARKKRVEVVSSSEGVLAYRTWRARFSVASGVVAVSRIYSGYSEADLASSEDRYSDKGLHREFMRRFT